MKVSTKSLFLTALATLLLYFSGFLAFATPVPLIYFSMRNSKDGVVKLVSGLITVAVVVHFVGVPLLSRVESTQDVVASIAPANFAAVLGPTRAACLDVGHFVVYLVLGLLIAQLLRKHTQEAPRHIFYFTTGLFLVAGILVLAIIGPHFSELIDAYRAQTLAGFKEFLVAQEKAGLGFEKLVMLQSLLPDIVKHSVYMMPFGFWLFVVVMFILNLILFRNYFLRSPLAKKNSPLHLGSFRMPFYCVWCVIALVSALMFNLKFGHSLIVFYFSLNVLAALFFAYFLQGLTIVIAFIERKKIFGPFQVFAYLLLFFLLVSVPFVLPLLVLLGFTENWIDIRAKIKTEAKTV
jgi:hypothetical protein